MSDQIPPPGPERDAEIARLLDPADHAIREWIEAPQRPLPRSLRRMPPPYSTDPAACDRLVEEMMRRGWNCQVTAQFDRRAAVFQGEAFSDGDCVIGDPAQGATIPDAVSAAALMALRGGR